MSKTIELVRQEVETIKNEVEDFANSASRIGEAMSDILEYNKELTETEANRAKDVEQSLSEEINNIKEAISNSGGEGGEGGEGSKEVTRAEFELVEVQSKTTFNAFSTLGMTEKADAEGYEIALAKATNTAEKTKVKVPVFDAQDMAKNPVGLVDEMFVEDMATMMDGKIDDALKDFTPPEGGGSNVTIVQETGASTTDVMSQKAVTDAIAAEKGRAELAEKELSDKIGNWTANDYGNTITENLNTINKALEDSVPDEVPTEGSQSTVMSGGVYQAIEEAVVLIPVPDEEDVTKTVEGKLKFANREYDSLAPNGMGHVILRKNKALTEQITSGTNNTIYEIRYDFDLGGETVYVGSGCAFKFVGGKISNGTIYIKNDFIYDYDILRIEAGAYQIFDNVTINGYFNAEKIHVEWFGAKGDYTTDDTEALRYAIKTLNGKGKTLHFSANKVYKVTDSLNYFDEGYNNLTNICLEGEIAVRNEPYPAYEDRPWCIKLADGISMFKNAEIQLRMNRIAIYGDWTDWVRDKTKVFDSCKLKGTVIENSFMSYLYCIFYNTGLWGVSKVSNNRFASIYNFSEINDSAQNSDYKSFVDSVIERNYITGHANTDEAKVDSYVDNVFFSWKVFNGSRINDNFVDYYRVMFTGCTTTLIVSKRNEYQVFKYFHKDCNICSNGDKFNWNDPEKDSVKETFSLYKDDTYVGNDGVTYNIPCYIAADSDLYDVIFKGMILENNVKNIIFRKGFRSAGRGNKKFIVKIEDGSSTNDDRSNSIVYEEGRTHPVYCSLAHSSTAVIDIDKALAHKSDVEPTNADYFQGAWGKVGLGEYVLYEYTSEDSKTHSRYYKVGYTNVTDNAEAYNPSFDKPDGDRVLPWRTSVEYVLRNSISIYSQCNQIYPVQTSEDRYRITTINVYDDILIGVPVVLYFRGRAIFTNFQDVYGNELVVDEGDIVTIVKTPDGVVNLLSYHKKDNNTMSGELSAAPTTGVTNGTPYYATDLQLTVYWNATRGTWVNADGYAAGYRSGARRAELTDSLTGLDAGLQFYDTLLGKLVIWNGDSWEGLEGSTVD